MNNYVEILRTHNLKVTPQRLEITTALDLHGHLSIEKLYEMLRHKFHSISLATIYKNINIMIEAAFIQEVKLPNTKSVYELTKSAHSHLLCQKCGGVEDIEIDLKAVCDYASYATGFTIEKTNLVLSGICKNCN